MTSSVLNYIKELSKIEMAKPEPIITGRITRLVGLTIEAKGLRVALGDYCSIQVSEDKEVDAEVIGFEGDSVYLMPLVNVEGLKPGSSVRPKGRLSYIPVGPELLGRVVDGLGRPIDGKSSLLSCPKVSLHGTPINPLDRTPITKPLDVGIAAINGMLTVGQGQRLGLFAGSGVGKSVLLGMMTKFTQAEIVVVGLIGERGREVQEFIQHSLGTEGMAKSIVVASPADESPLMRLRAAETTNRIAEYFRDKGHNVLLLMDSLTRYAQAQREVALAVGEPPATKGYPPSVFAKLPKLVERAGNGKAGGGSITAFYTVLTEGDDQQDPIADSARAILDGHIVLSRSLAERGHYPAIDIEASISRVMQNIVDERHLLSAIEAKRCWSKYYQNEDLITVGAYVQGTDPAIDKSIIMRPRISGFLNQTMNTKVPFAESVQKLMGALDQTSEAPSNGAQ